MAAAGRRPRPRYGIEYLRRKFWARSVLLAAKRPLKELEEVLGNDGRWNGLWSRYAKSSVSPSKDRIVRIDKILPGTARYYFSPLWTLLVNREFHRSELLTAVQFLDKRFQAAFIAEDESASGLFWRADVSLPVLLDMATHLISDEKMGLDAVTVILILIREAELRQDGASYLLSMKAWAQLEYLRNQHQVLALLPDALLDYVVEPLRYMCFAQAVVRELWDEHVEYYCWKKNDDQEDFELIDCLNWLELTLEI